MVRLNMHIKSYFYCDFLKLILVLVTCIILVIHITSLHYCSLQEDQSINLKLYFALNEISHLDIFDSFNRDRRRGGNRSKRKDRKTFNRSK